jgi:hypothetical protein
MIGDQAESECGGPGGDREQKLEIKFTGLVPAQRNVNLAKQATSQHGSKISMATPQARDLLVHARVTNTYV